jgi:hypothetical protein
MPNEPTKAFIISKKQARDADWAAPLGTCGRQIEGEYLPPTVKAAVDGRPERNRTIKGRRRNENVRDKANTFFAFTTHFRWRGNGHDGNARREAAVTRVFVNDAGSPAPR